MYMRNACKKILVLALLFAGLATFAHRAQAQTTTTLLDFTKVWKYDSSGANLGTAWRTNSPPYDDSTWASGPGLLGFDDALAPYLVHVPSGLGTTLPISGSITTYYFRTTFSLPISPTTPGLVLMASNLVDDGCLIWLNGRLAGALRVPTTATSATLATGGPAAEGTVEVLTLTNFLRAGVNTIAVEVHQSSATSSDVMWGMKLVTIVPTALAITSQPVSLERAVGESASFSVGVSGGPVFYRWQKDGVNILNATNSSYSISAVTLPNQGDYRVIVSNAVTVVTSSVARLTVVDDTTGPKVLEAIIDNGFGSNRVYLKFDESLTSASASVKNSPRNPANYRLVSSTDPTSSIAISNVISHSGAQVLLSVVDPSWNPKGSYYLLLNNIADRSENQINPNTVVGLGVQIFTNLTQMSDIWSYYDCASISFCDPNSDAVYANQAFSKTNFVQDPFTWGSGRGIFVRESGLGEIQPCSGDIRGDIIGFQLEPTLFRRTFVLPNNASSNGNLRIRFIFDDGMLVYLNGQPLYSNNVVGPITRDSRSLNFIADASCNTNVSLNVSTLRPGTNWLVAAVVQSASNPESDTVFGFEMDLVTIQANPAPTNRPPGTPTLVRTRQADKFVLSWPSTNYGYALMYSTAIAGTGTRPDRNWYTNEANWFQVRDQSNPYTNNIPPTNGPVRFYKLFREKLND